MEREQRSEGLLRDFIRANCQRMKHELAKRDCGLGQYRRDPGAAAAVILLQLHSQCVKRTHTITHTSASTRRPPAHWHTQCHNWPAKSGRALAAENHRCQRKRKEGPHPAQSAQTSSPDIWKSSHQKVCVCVCLCPCASLPACLTAFIFHIGQKKKAMIFFFIVSVQSLIHPDPQ